MWLDIDETFGDILFDGNNACNAVNNVAKTVNTEKEVFESDIEELEKGIELLERYTHDRIMALELTIFWNSL